MTKRRDAAASGGVKGSALGAAIGVVIEIVCVIAERPLPPGSASSLAGALGVIFGYFMRGGRRGEAD